MYAPTVHPCARSTCREGMSVLSYVCLSWLMRTLVSPKRRPMLNVCTGLSLPFSSSDGIVKWSEVKVAQSCITLCDSMKFSRPEYWSGSLSLLQGIFPTQGLNPGLLHCRRILYQLSHKGSPWYSEITEKIKFQVLVGSPSAHNLIGQKIAHIAIESLFDLNMD